MKIPFKIFLLCCFFSASMATIVSAQDKIAYVSVEDVIQAMPEYKMIQGQLETFQEQLLKQLEEEKRSIAKYYRGVLEKVKQGALSPKEQKDAETELQKRQGILDKNTSEADNKLVIKEQALTQPVYEKFNTALKSVAKANGYTYILDKKLTIYSAGGINATDELKKEMAK
jgi:outer membrane protein